MKTLIEGITWNITINGMTAAKWGDEYIVNPNHFLNWFQGGEPEWVYKPQARICSIYNRMKEEIPNKFGVINETGWNGYEEESAYLVGMVFGMDEAMKLVNQIIY
jgi:hypothetical protein